MVHDRAAVGEAREFIARLRATCETIVLAGNHDRRLTSDFSLRASWQTKGFYFHHGHCAVETPDAIQIIGHHHPAGSVTDGAGLRLKLPAFVQDGNCWIMPAFSPWAAGARWYANASSRMWLCTPKRILELPQLEAAG